MEKTASGAESAKPARRRPGRPNGILQQIRMQISGNCAPFATDARAKVTDRERSDPDRRTKLWEATESRDRETRRASATPGRAPYEKVNSRHGGDAMQSSASSSYRSQPSSGYPHSTSWQTTSGPASSRRPGRWDDGWSQLSTGWHRNGARQWQGTVDEGWGAISDWAQAGVSWADGDGDRESAWKGHDAEAARSSSDAAEDVPKKVSSVAGIGLPVAKRRDRPAEIREGPIVASVTGSRPAGGSRSGGIQPRQPMQSKGLATGGARKERGQSAGRPSGNRTNHGMEAEGELEPRQSARSGAASAKIDKESSGLSSCSGMRSLDALQQAFQQRKASQPADRSHLRKG